MSRSDYPLTLDELLSALCDQDLIYQVLLTRTSDGNWQASAKKDVPSKYHVRLNSDPVKALRLALQPLSSQIGSVSMPSGEDDGDDLEDIL